MAQSFQAAVTELEHHTPKLRPSGFEFLGNRSDTPMGDEDEEEEEEEKKREIPAELSVQMQQELLDFANEQKTQDNLDKQKLKSSLESEANTYQHRDEEA